MLKNVISVACLAAMLGFGVPSISTAQVSDLGKKAGQVTKDAAKKTAEAGKKVGEGVKEGAEKATTGTKEAVTGVPKGATGRCKDGTYTMAKTRRGACSDHHGIEKWY
jgi:hypothetical protein